MYLSVWMSDLMCYEVLPVSAETLRLRANLFAVNTPWYSEAHIQPVFNTLRQNFSFVLFILLWSEQFATIIVTHSP